MPFICPQCSTANADGVAICGGCAARLTSTSTALVPVRPRSRLPVLSQSEKATLGSVALGLAALAVRVGVSLLQQGTEQRRDAPVVERPAPSQSPAREGDRWVVRRRWVTGDASGAQQWGEEELEITAPDAPSSSLKLWLRRPPS